MNRKLILTCAALVATLALGVTAAIAGTVRGGADPGITDTSILLGGTAPLTGPASQYASVARGAEAYFKYLNATRGGVNGRTITYKYADDAYNPAQSVPVTRQLVEQDKVFAVFNSLGTAHNVAVRPYLNAMKVPQLFVASGATTWGRDYGAVPVHDRLPAELPGGGLGLRQVPRANRSRRQGGRSVPERRLREGSPGWPQARPAAFEGEGRSRPSRTRSRHPTSPRRSQS